MSPKLEIPSEGTLQLPNGCTLYWQTGEMGREYYSDEVGGGVTVWHPCLVASSTLLAAIVQEDTLAYMESINKKSSRPGDGK